MQVKTLTASDFVGVSSRALKALWKKHPQNPVQSGEPNCLGENLIVREQQ
jgi:hypothetical protein